jgi:signal transduction histidine kinase
MEKPKYDLTSIINEVRSAVDTWRRLPESQWHVPPEKAALIRHWRHHAFSSVRPPIVRDEIYRIASEALRNAFRHAEAQQIEVELRYDERHFDCGSETMARASAPRS